MYNSKCVCACVCVGHVECGLGPRAGMAAGSRLSADLDQDTGAEESP